MLIYELGVRNSVLDVHVVALDRVRFADACISRSSVAEEQEAKAPGTTIVLVPQDLARNYFAKPGKVCLQFAEKAGWRGERFKFKVAGTLQPLLVRRRNLPVGQRLR